MYDLPTKLNIGGVDYDIREKGDFRVVISTFSVLEDTSLSKNERIAAALCVFYEDMYDVDCLEQFSDLQEALDQMFWFFNAGRPEGGRKDEVKLIDWNEDSAMVCAAINDVAGKEIRAESYLHWWTFVGYYMSVKESTMSTVLDIREKIQRGKKLEKWEREFRMKNPQYFNWKRKTAEEQEIEDWVVSQWCGETV